MGNEVRSNNGDKPQKSINDLPDEIVRLILEYANTCEREGYITLPDVMHELSRVYAPTMSLSPPGVSFDVSDESPPDLALLDARRVCKRWYDISETIIYRRVGHWLKPAAGNRVMGLFVEHFYEKRRAARCYGQTHAVKLEHGDLLHCIVAHHRESNRTRMHFLRRTMYESFDRAPGSTQEWDGCDCLHTTSVDMATGNDFLIAMLTRSELEKTTQLVWRGSFARSDSEMLVRCVKGLDMAREALKLSAWHEAEG